jgi:hypothetical protein
VARCALVQGQLLAESDPAAAEELLTEAAGEYERLGVPGLARRAREPVA